MRGSYGPLVGSIDEGTSSTRFMVFSSQTAKLIASHQIPLKSITPKEGWVEQDPKEILNAVIESIERTTEKLKQISVDVSEIVAIGITNQRETTIVWDSITGEPLYNAIVWLDSRTSTTVEELLEKTSTKTKNLLQPLCGLPLSPYFSALKLRWLIDNVPKVKEAIKANRCKFGTVDSWLIWNLTGGNDGGIHVTDVTNASRTMLMNIKTLMWDPELCKFFNIPTSILPNIHSSSEIYGYISKSELKGKPISGCLGDQHAALLGQLCLNEGQAKSTCGTGCFLLYNTGLTKIDSQHGLLTTVAWKLGNRETVYALEGSVAVAGAAINWLRDNIKIIDNTKDIEQLATSVLHTSEVYFVPAFSGLYAPYWQPDARGIICGLTENTERGHIIWAALEAVCFQTRDVLEAMLKDCGMPLKKLQVDGGMTSNNLLMQLQADLCGIPVVRPKIAETTALGAAMAAGYAEGIKVWDISNTQGPITDTFQPVITEDERNSRYEKWKLAVQRSFGWETA